MVLLVVDKEGKAFLITATSAKGNERETSIDLARSFKHNLRQEYQMDDHM
jgi:hypothetical protein